ncbi:ABC transporter six-transmembrane domain-containing protein [Isoptericola sp. NPDC055881]
MPPLLDGYRARIALSVLLIVAETAGVVVVPFVIGVAVDDYLDGSIRGLVWLIGVGLTTVLVSTARRLHDARLYSQIYERAGASALPPSAGLSQRAGRLNLLREAVDFLEHTVPEIVGGVLAFVGILAFLVALSVPVFVGSLVMAALVVAIYAASTRQTMAANRGYNDEYERQVDVLRRGDGALTRRHLGLLNTWLTRLSDLDAINYALSMVLTIALQVFAIITCARAGMDDGTMLSVVLYVFEFSAAATLLPVSWQGFLRLRDILGRLRKTPPANGSTGRPGGQDEGTRAKRPSSRTTARGRDRG